MSDSRRSWWIKGSYQGRITKVLSSTKGEELVPLRKEIVDKNGNVTKEFRGRAKFVGTLLQANGLTHLPEFEIKYPTKLNIPKDIGYLEERKLADKYSIDRDAIISLAGARPLHISLMLGQKQGLFHTFVKYKKDFDKLFPYCESLKYNSDIDFSVRRQDILQYMKVCAQRYKIMDLDLCATLSRMADSLIEAIANCADNRVLLCLTHTMRGMGGADKVAVYEAREYFIGRLKEYFEIIDGMHTYYYNSVVMFREVFVLERKAA